MISISLKNDEFTVDISIVNDCLAITDRHMCRSNARPVVLMKYSSADRSQPTLLVSLDLSAAFDTIDHKFSLTGSLIVLGSLARY